MAARIAIRECLKQGFRYPKIVAYDEQNRPWVFTGELPRMIVPFLVKVREAGSIDPAHWRRRG